MVNAPLAVLLRRFCSYLNARTCTHNATTCGSDETHVALSQLSLSLLLAFHRCLCAHLHAEVSLGRACSPHVVLTGIVQTGTGKFQSQPSARLRHPNADAKEIAPQAARSLLPQSLTPHAVQTQISARQADPETRRGMGKAMALDRVGVMRWPTVWRWRWSRSLQ